MRRLRRGRWTTWRSLKCLCSTTSLHDLGEVEGLRTEIELARAEAKEVAEENRWVREALDESRLRCSEMAEELAAARAALRARETIEAARGVAKAAKGAKGVGGGGGGGGGGDEGGAAACLAASSAAWACASKASNP